MKISTKLEKNSGGHYIPLEEEDAKSILEKMGKTVIVEINDFQLHCAILRNNRLGYYIMASKTVVKNIKAETGDELILKVQKDNTEYQGVMPEELKAVLDTDPEALIIFDSLTPGKKRSIMHMVNSAKQVDTRINRALKIAQNLKLGARKPPEFLK